MKEKNSQKQQNNDENAIITIDEIQRILSEFKIGKKPLAKLLGWGETTIIRYIEGDLPTTEYSDKLKMILYNPCYYYDILLKNKDNLTGVAFRKSKKAVLNKLMDSKINVIAQYMINQYPEEMTPGYIQYLLYYSQGFSLALFDQEMFDEDYYINAKDVPYLKLHEQLSQRGNAVLELDEDALTQDEKTIVDQVCNSFLWYGKKAVAAMATHEKALLRISRDKDNNKVITKETMKTLFKELLNQYDIHSTLEIHKYPDERIVEIRNLL